MKKRALVLFTLLLFILSGVVLQVYRLSDAYLSQAADQQGSVTVKVANSRGTIYDARLRPLTNAGEEYRLSVTPSPEAIAALSGMLDEEQLAAVSERLQSPPLSPCRKSRPIWREACCSRCRCGTAAACWPPICWAIWTGTVSTA